MGRQFAVVLTLAAGQAFAQQPVREASATATNSTALRDDARLSTPLLEDTKRTEDVIVRKNVELSGPLVRPFKARKIGEVPKRLLHLINPFAPSERKEEWESTRGLNTRAWTSIVGWNPGGSAFSDAVTHESSMGLFSLAKAAKD